MFFSSACFTHYCRFYIPSTSPATGLLVPGLCPPSLGLRSPMVTDGSGAAMGPGHESDTGHHGWRTQPRNSRKFRNITPSLG